MRSLLILVVVLLSACQSEFENCMETELPRAQQGLSDVTNQIKRYESLAQTYLQVAKGFLINERDWEANYLRAGGPPFPSLSCDSGFDVDPCRSAYEKYHAERSEWEKTPDGIKYLESERRREVTNMIEAGVPLPENATPDDLYLFFDEDYPEVDEMLSALAKTSRVIEANCWGIKEYMCDNPIQIELNFTQPDLEWPVPFYTALITLGEEVFREWFDEMNADVQNQIYETAKLACNRGGIYE